MNAELRLPTSSVRRVVRSELERLGGGSKAAAAAGGSGGGGVFVQSAAQHVITASSTVFINYIVSIAVEICRERRRTGLSAGDVIEALRETDFGDIAEVVEAAATAASAVPPRQKVRQAGAGVAAEGGDGDARPEIVAEVAEESPAALPDSDAPTLAPLGSQPSLLPLDESAANHDFPEESDDELVVVQDDAMSADER